MSPGAMGSPEHIPREHLGAHRYWLLRPDRIGASDGSFETDVPKAGILARHRGKPFLKADPLLADMDRERQHVAERLFRFACAGTPTEPVMYY